MRSIIVAAAVLAATPAAAVSFINSSFESGAMNASLAAPIVSDQRARVDNITLDGSDWVGNFTGGSQGSQAFNLADADGNVIFQRLSGLIAGRTYRLSFDMSGDPTGGPRTVRLRTSTSGSQVNSFTYDVTSENSLSDMRWEQRSYLFTAVGGTQEFQFRSPSNDSLAAIIDNIQLSLVPEPASWAMLLMGFSLVGAAARRRRRATAA